MQKAYPDKSWWLQTSINYFEDARWKPPPICECQSPCKQEDSEPSSPVKVGRLVNGFSAHMRGRMAHPHHMPDSCALKLRESFVNGACNAARASLFTLTKTQVLKLGLLSVREEVTNNEQLLLGGQEHQLSNRSASSSTGTPCAEQRLDSRVERIRQKD